MTELLYMDDIESNYIREFDATVTKSKKDYVVLDRSAFYPEGGGQPADTGILQWNEHEAKVIHVAKKGIIKHVLDGDRPPEGTTVHGVLDWERRHAHMQMHTAQHVISGIVYDLYEARTVGNQIHADYSRVDFKPASFTDDDLAAIEARCNEVIDTDADVTITEEERSSLEQRVNPERCNLDLLPSSIKNLRIVEIEGFDVCPCAGTHVKNTGEIPRISIIRRESKGKDTERIVYRLGTDGQ
ncbi:MAG: alanyl-tRNA editing protein [Thermoplasmatota archaeon]